MADMAHRLFASFVEYNGDPSYVADPKLWASLTDSPRISSYSIFSVLCLLVFAAACMCPVYVSYTVCTYTYDKFSTTEYFFIVCIRRTQHKISFEKKQLEPTKQSAKKASASTVGRCAIIAVSFPSSHFHARTFTAEKEKRETTRTESVHRPFFFFLSGIASFLLSFFSFFHWTVRRSTSGHRFIWDAGPYAYNVWWMGTLGVLIVIDQAEEKKTKFA